MNAEEDNVVCPYCHATISTWDCPNEIIRDDLDTTRTQCPECGRTIDITCYAVYTFEAEKVTE